MGLLTPNRSDASPLLVGFLWDRPVHQRKLEEFDQSRSEFMTIFKEEGRRMCRMFENATYRSNIMESGWRIGKFWYFCALNSPKGLFNVFRQHIQRIFAPMDMLTADFERSTSSYSASDAEAIIATKLKDKEMYEDTLRQRFRSRPEALKSS
jgi:hypothetical protein